MTTKGETDLVFRSPRKTIVVVSARSQHRTVRIISQYPDDRRVMSVSGVLPNPSISAII